MKLGNIKEQYVQCLHYNVCNTYYTVLHVYSLEYLKAIAFY